MVIPSSLLICLLAALSKPLAATNDVCLSDNCLMDLPSEAGVAIDADHILDDASGEGSQFMQKSTVATHGGKALEVSSARHSQPEVTGISKIKPMDCLVNNKPMQMVKGSNGFSLSELNVEDGHYTLLFDYPWDFVDGEYADLNACDVNPFDEIVYCVLRADGKSYAVRMDNSSVEYVARLPSSVWSSGAFSYTGEYFVSMIGAELIIVPPIHELPGYADRTHFKLKDYSDLKADKPRGFWYTADMVIVEMNITGSTSEENLISLYGPKLQVASIVDGKVHKTWVKEVRPGRWDNIYGAAFNYNNFIFFSTNRGAGVYAIPLEDVNLDDETQVVNLEIVGLSDPTDFNDGLNCKRLPNPWAYAATTTTIPESTTEAATEAPAEAPTTAAPVAEATPVPVLETEAPEATKAPVAAAPTLAPALAPALPVIPATPEPPPQPGAWRLLALLLIPLVLAICCRSLHPPPPYARGAPSKNNDPPAKPGIAPVKFSPFPFLAPSLPPGSPPRSPMPSPPRSPISSTQRMAPPPFNPAPVATPAPAPRAPPAPPPVQAQPVVRPGVTEIDKVTASGQVLERDFIIGVAPASAPARAVTEIDRVTASGQVVERDFIIGAAPQVATAPGVNASGQVFERDFIVGGAPRVATNRTVTEIDRMTASGQVVERDFIVGGAAQVVSAPAVTEIDKVTASGQVVERDFIVGGAPRVVTAPAVTEIDRMNASGQVVERDFLIGGPP